MLHVHPEIQLIEHYLYLGKRNIIRVIIIRLPIPLIPELLRVQVSIQIACFFLLKGVRLPAEESLRGSLIHQLLLLLFFVV